MAVGGVVAALVLLIEVYLGGVLTYIWFWPLPPAWVGFFMSLIAGLVGPRGCGSVLASGAAAVRTQPPAILGRVEHAAIYSGLLSLVIVLPLLLLAALGTVL